jgi:uncharacterized protein YgiM (DUF1202 family)
MRLAINSHRPNILKNFLVRRPQVCAAFVAVILAATVVANGEESFPYTGFVARDRTPLLSGPGDDHYATDELKRGTEVEVYRRAEGGWLAIRPPQSSFSWVSQRDVKLTGQTDVAEVIGSAAVSWIGSNVLEVSDHRWLVKLDRGESVTLLGKERRRMLTAGKSDVFYKITPPSGEFRWLHEDDLVKEKAEVAAIQDPDVELADFRVALRGTPRAAPSTESQATATQPEQKSEPKKDAFTSREKQSGTTRESVGELALIPKRSSTPSPAKTETKSTISLNGDLESKLRELDAQLSLVASQPAESWNFTALRASAEQLSESGSSTLDRARVQLYLDKLAEFEGLKSRHALMAPKPKPTGPAPKLSANGEKSLQGSSLDPRFDGTGWLLPVHSTKKASPPYALLDKEGNILQFVSPAPGLNLNRYLRKEIGVFGQKDQTTTLDKPHLTAHRIVELDRHRK